ncbi:MAG: DEAD/DEAH box helicase, partial [Actinobacteria bacterium]|nr:DEAD/DEAH box helicase [Actinomycetota bacterium]
LGLRPELLKALAGLGYEEPTPIQREAIPHMINGKDLLGQAATGTGKTAAFALPILQLLDMSNDRPSPVALVLVPTRELAMQVSEAIYKYGHDLRARCVPIYGGQPIGRQIDALSRGTHVVVATPGRALDHIRKKTLKLDNIKMVVLDEADEMLDMGFAEDLEAILESTPKERQTVLFSATMPPRIDSIARRHQREPIRITIQRSSTEAGTLPLVKQSAYMIPRHHKAAALGRILDIEAPEAAIVFCRTRGEVDQLTETLNGRGYRAEALHGGMDQEQRDRVMGRFRSGVAELLIATDVAARGLDIDHLTHVVNYDVPSAPESYVHRIGRVGRAGREGVAITLAEPREQRQLQNIERLTKQKIPFEKVPSVEALRARQMALTTETLREALASAPQERFESVLTELLQEFNIEQIALAAIKLTHDADQSSLDEVHIPDLSQGDTRDRRDRGDSRERGNRGDSRGDSRERGNRGDSRGDSRERFDRSGSNDRSSRFGRDERPDRGGRFERGAQRGSSGATAKLYVGLGRKAGIRPQDLVGAIANESGISGRDIGDIKVSDQFSIVEVPSGEMDNILKSMTNVSIRGKKANIRLYRDER